MTLETAGGERSIPSSALEVVAHFIREAAVIDGIKGSVKIFPDYNAGPRSYVYRIHVFFPRALVTYGYYCDVIPVFLPQVGAKCADLAERLTRVFGKHGSRSTKAMVKRINRHLSDSVTRIVFHTFKEEKLHNFRHSGDTVEASVEQSPDNNA